MEHDEIDVVRTPGEVARRTLALFAYVAVGLGADRRGIMAWLEGSDLAQELSPTEAAFLGNEEPTDRDLIHASWCSERLVVLLWALGLSDMPEADQQCDTSSFLSILPPFAQTDAHTFIASAELRDEAAISEMAEKIWQLNWSARDASINRRAPAVPVDLGLIQERHHAINWVMGYGGEDWDDVTTDT